VVCASVCAASVAKTTRPAGVVLSAATVTAGTHLTKHLAGAAVSASVCAAALGTAGQADLAGAAAATATISAALKLSRSLTPSSTLTITVAAGADDGYVSTYGAGTLYPDDFEFGVGNSVEYGDKHGWIVVDLPVPTGTAILDARLILTSAEPPL
jgi:hypothetical protein